MKKRKKLKKVRKAPTEAVPKKKRKKKKKKVRMESGDEPKKDYASLFQRTEKPGTSIVLRCLQNANRDGSYPPHQKTWWGNRMEEREFDDIWELWEGHMSFMGAERKAALRELMVGLAESQIWEVYTFIRDLGTRTQRTRSVHAMRIEQGIRDKRAPKKKKLKKKRKGV